MARFVSFIHSAQDIEYFRREFPEHEFFYISPNAIPSIGAVVRQGAVDQAIEKLKKEHAIRPFAGIVFGAKPERCVKSAHQVAGALGLRRFLSDPELVRDKYAMRLAMAGKVACPQTRVVREEEVAANLPDLKFPCVLKPRHGFNSMHVFKAKDRAELASAQKSTQTAMAHNARRHPLAIPSNDMLLEDFVGGTEHTVELFMADGRPLLELVSDKMTMEAPYFVETGDVMPSRLSPDDVERVKVAARSAAKAVGFEFGWAHVEIKLEYGVAHVIEIAGRPGGGYTRAMVRRAYGIDPRRVLIEAHLGSLPGQPDHAANTVFGRNVVCVGIELVVSIQGLAAATRTEGFQTVQSRFSGRPRIFVGPPISFDSTIMSYFVFDPSPDTAAAKFQTLDSKIRPRKIGFRLGSPAQLALPFLLIERIGSWKK
jgi:cysteine synthase A